MLEDPCPLPKPQMPPFTIKCKMMQNLPYTNAEAL